MIAKEKHGEILVSDLMEAVCHLCASLRKLVPQIFVFNCLGFKKQLHQGGKMYALLKRLPLVKWAVRMLKIS